MGEQTVMKSASCKERPERQGKVEEKFSEGGVFVPFDYATRANII